MSPVGVVSATSSETIGLSSDESVISSSGTLDGAASGKGKKKHPRKPKKGQKLAPHQRWDSARRQMVEAYINDLAVALDLSDWEIALSWKTLASSDADAEVSPVEGRRIATVYLGRGFAKLSAFEQKRVLVHELLHLHTALLTYSVHKAVAPLRGGSMFLPTFDLLEESVVDALALVIARLLDEIPWADALTNAGGPGSRQRAVAHKKPGTNKGSGGRKNASAPLGTKG